MLYGIEFTFSEILLLLSLLTGLTIGLIFVLKYKMFIAGKSLSSKNIKDSSHNRTKYAEVDSFKYSKVLLKYGLAISIAFSFVIISWTTENVIVYDIGDIETFEDEFDKIESPIVNFPKPPPPPIPPIIEPVIDIVETVENVSLLSEVVEVDIPIEPSLIKGIIDTSYVEKRPEPIFEKPIEEDDDAVVIIAEQMPRFPGCEGENSKEEKELCAQKKLLTFIYDNIKYPIAAKELGIEGVCVLRFVVDKLGKIKDVSLVRDIGGGCGQTSIKAIKKMNKMENRWSPGKQGGKPVNVQYTLPIKFKLD